MRTLPVRLNFSFASWLPFTLLRVFGILVPVASLLHWVTYLRDGVTPAGSWPACLRSERRFSISIWVRYAGRFLAGHTASVCGYLRTMSRCVAWWSSLCPYRWVTLSSLQGSSRSLVRGLACLSSPTLFSAGWGWCLGRLLSFAPCCRLCPLSGCTSLILCAPLAVVCFQVHLTDSVPCLQIAF